MQQKDNNRMPRPDQRRERRPGAVDRPSRWQSAPLKSVARASGAGAVAPRPAIELPPASIGPAPRPSMAGGIRRTLASRGGLRQALLLNEILGPPVSLRKGSE
jgi:hypothetical protein